MEFGLKHKPQLRQVQTTALCPHEPMIGRDKSKVVNDEIVEFRKADDPMEVAERANKEPQVLDRQMRVSRSVEEHEFGECSSVTATTWQQNEGVVVCKCSISRTQRLQHPGLLTGGYCFLVIGYEFPSR